MALDAPGCDADSRRWLDELGSDGPEHHTAVAALHALLRRVAGREAARRAGTYGLHGVELDDVAQQAADDAVVSVLRRLPDFAGRSRFTTWASKFAILEVAQKIARHRWRRDTITAEAEDWDALPGRLAGGPEQVAEARELAAVLRELVATELTPRQTLVFEALFVARVPFDVLAERLGTNRNALYKAEFDIRAKLRRHLVARGLLPEEDGR